MGTPACWMGLDIGELRTHLCVIDEQGKTLHDQECETTLEALATAISAFEPENIREIGVEAGVGTHLVRKLRQTGLPVTMFEARKASKFLSVRRSKTDKGDARGLADLARLGTHTVSQVHLKSQECERLRSQLVLRQRIVLLRVTAQNALRSRLAFYGLQFRSTIAVGGVRKQVAAQVARFRESDGIDLASDLAPLVDVCETLRDYLKKLDKEIAKIASGNAVCRLLMEVPGVGPICSLSFYTAIDDPDRFQRASDVGSYLGLNPKRYQSGDVSLTLGITKNGSKLTRSHLFSAALTFGKSAPDCALKRWYFALRQRRGGRRARVALARKLAIILLTMWKTGAHFEARPL